MPKLTVKTLTSILDVSARYGVASTVYHWDRAGIR